MGDLEPGALAALAGLAGGTILGIAARWGRFCTLSSIETAAFGGDTRGLRAWGLAIAVSIIGTYGLDQVGLIDLSDSFYLASPVSLVATVLGGFLFGIGMALAGTCGYGCLARMGGGDLKSFVTFLVMGITAYATLRGATAYLRLAFTPAAPETFMPASFAHFITGSASGWLHPVAYLMAAALAALCFASPAFRADIRKVVVGLAVGAVIVWGWASTAAIGREAFEPVTLESYTFSAPLGESLVYLMTMSGASLDFGIGAVAGVIIGAAATAILQGHFRWEASDDPRELRRHIAGGALMGFGSVTALGCTIGQGISAASTLAFSAPLALFAMFCGATLGLHYLIRGSFLEPIRDLFTRGA